MDLDAEATAERLFSLEGAAMEGGHLIGHLAEKREQALQTLRAISKLLEAVGPELGLGPGPAAPAGRHEIFGLLEAHRSRLQHEANAALQEYHHDGYPSAYARSQGLADGAEAIRQILAQFDDQGARITGAPAAAGEGDKAPPPA